jgi:hypothetical protein
MAKWRSMKSAPTDGAHVLLYVEDVVIEGYFYDEVDRLGERYGPGYWLPVNTSSHGCGCCGERNAPPVAWQPLPVKPPSSAC